MGINRVIMVGNVGRDAELFSTKNGQPFCKFSLAVTTGSKDSKNTEWFTCVAWNNTAEYLAEHVKKGMKLYVEGFLRSREVEKDGLKNRYWDLNIDRVEFMSAKQNQDDEEDRRPAYVDPDEPF